MQRRRPKTRQREQLLDPAPGRLFPQRQGLDGDPSGQEFTLPGKGPAHGTDQVPLRHRRSINAGPEQKIGSIGRNQHPPPVQPLELRGKREDDPVFGLLNHRGERARGSIFISMKTVRKLGLV